MEHILLAARKRKDKRDKEYSFKACSRIKRPDGLVMHGMKRYTFRSFVEAVEARYGKMTCYAVYGSGDEGRWSYGHMAYVVRSISQYLVDLGIGRGDRVCIYGESSPRWMMFYLGVVSIGAIAVPILPGFTGRETVTALEDSGACAICLGAHQFSQVADFIKERGLTLFRLEDLFHIPDDQRDAADASSFPSLPGRDITRLKAKASVLSKLPLDEDDTASIIYTSGTTGSSKGVVLTHKNILRNADRSSWEYVKLKPGMRVLSILPVSHIYEFTIGQVLSLENGLEVYFLGRPPAPSILMPALAKVRPHVMQTVPLLIEKVYKSAVAPVIKGSGSLAKAYSNPLLKNLVAHLVTRRLKAAFGGKLIFFGIGGSALDREVEDFLCRGGFPYALGYGLTETSPLLAGCGPGRREHKLGFVGPVHPDVDLIILDPDKEGVGEIAVKGPNVTPGYYKNEELDKEAFTTDGYFRTGDLGLVDKRGRLAIKGRCKSVILGPAGENIYPESIESVINNMQFVQESLVVPEGAGLMALIRIDIEAMAKAMRLSIEEAKAQAREYAASLRAQVNKQLSAQNRIDSVELQEEEFERTASQKIKRFLYPKKKRDQGHDSGAS